MVMEDEGRRAGRNMTMTRMTTKRRKAHIGTGRRRKPGFFGSESPTPG